MNEKKYTFTGEEIFKYGEVLKRIIALKNFGNVKKGEKGGFIESERNLSHEGNCWVADEAIVKDQAQIYGDAQIKNESCVCENARIGDKVYVVDEAYICGRSWILDNAHIGGRARIYGEVRIEDNVCIDGNAQIGGQARVLEHARISGLVEISGMACISGKAKVSEEARIVGRTCIRGKAKVYNKQIIKYGELTIDIFKTKNWEQAIYNLFGIKPVNNKIVLYKKVWKTKDKNVFVSCYDRNFKYVIGEISEVKDFDKDIFQSCAEGLHFSDPEYWHKGDSLLACEIDIDDIITVLGGEVRCKKCLVLQSYDLKDTKGCYYQYGSRGKKFYYECGNKEARERAKKKAEDDGRRIEYFKNKDN